MAGNLHEAARIARDAATSENADWQNFSVKMCWDAVVSCAEKAGLAPGSITGIEKDVYLHFIPTVNQITSAAGMRAVPQGAFIGFFDHSAGQDSIVHAMMATGHGLAAGTKNGCIGVGAPIGWEILNLGETGLWNGSTFGPRNLKIFSRDNW